MPRTLLCKTHTTVSEYPEVAFRARITLQRFKNSVLRQTRALFRSYASSPVKRKLLRLERQKFGYSVMGQIGALVLEILLCSETDITDITSIIRIQHYFFRTFTSKIRIVLKNLLVDIY